jgi:tetratricopeptide (TPR) repeat protein
MLSRFFQILVVFLCLIGFGGAVHAKWYVVESEHFVIYADQKAETTQRFARQLENFHGAMAFLFGQLQNKPSPSSRVTIYVVDGEKQVRELLGSDNRFAAGFYKPRAGATIAVVPTLRSSVDKTELSSQIILQHEYAHHFMYQLSSIAPPLWFTEGFAEFFGSARFGRDDAILLGANANHRAYELLWAKDVPIDLLLDTKRYRTEKNAKGYDNFYGKAWLLYHFLEFDDNRKGQRLAYLNRVLTGASEIEAATSVFGDLKKLESELLAYQRRKQLLTYAIPPEKFTVSSIMTRELREGEAAMMPVIIRSRVGVDQELAAAILADAQSIAAQYPDDPAVLSALAEAEHDAGNYAAAITAADRALARNPKEVNAYVQKGFALAAQAEDADDPEAMWREVRSVFVGLNRIENDHPLPLIWFYRSYIEQNQKPTALAVQGLRRALELAPFDGGLRMIVAEDYADSGEIASAIATLRPLANNPHDSELTMAAASYMAALEAMVAKDQQPSATTAN